MRGFAGGTSSASGDGFGLVAEAIGRVKVGAPTAPLTRGVDTAGFALTGDLRMREV